MQLTVLVALLAQCLGTFINSFGLILMKQAITSGDQSRHQMLRPRYLLGFSCLVVAALILMGKSTVE